MNYISDILTQNYSDQGIQDLKIYYDSLFFNVKVKNGLEYYNILLIEKYQYDYDSNTISKTDNGLVLNFGDTENSQAFKTNGNCFISSFLDKKRKKVLLVGLKQTISANTVPVIYEYDINSHSFKFLFPNTNDLENFESFDNFNFNGDYFPIANYIDDEIYISFKSQDNDYQYINNIILKKKNEFIEIKNYEMYRYGKTTLIDFKNLDKNNLTFSYNSYFGILSKT